MENFPNQDPNQERNETCPKIEREKVVSLKSVEEIIPNIKERMDKPEHQVSYKSNKFTDPFMRDFATEWLPYSMSGEDSDVLHSDFKILEERMKDKIVVDLGAGDHCFGYYLSTLLGAKAYVGVEKFHSDDLKKAINGISMESIRHIFNRSRKTEQGYQLKETMSLPEAAVTDDDMLSFLKRLPDKSVCITALGIDQFVIPDEKYRDRVAEEVERVLVEGGILVTDGLRPKILTNVMKLLEEQNDLFSYSLAFRDEGERMYIRPEENHDLIRGFEKMVEEFKERRYARYRKTKVESCM